MNFYLIKEINKYGFGTSFVIIANDENEVIQIAAERDHWRKSVWLDCDKSTCKEIHADKQGIVLESIDGG